jgi:hypothetical protein
MQADPSTHVNLNKIMLQNIKREYTSLLVTKSFFFFNKYLLGEKVILLIKYLNVFSRCDIDLKFELEKNIPFLH